MGRTQEERMDYLMKVLVPTGRISTRDAVHALGVSEATVRRLFADLEKKGKVMRDYGGIVLLGADTDYNFEKKERQFTLEKQWIGACAANLAQEGDTLYLDCGTTTFQLALALLKRIEAGELRAIQVVTNSLANLQTLSPHCRVLLIGGEYSPARRDFSGALSQKFVQNLHFSRCFLGADGATAEAGYTAGDVNIAHLNECVIRRSEWVHVLVDGSKIGRNSFVSYASPDQVHALITAGQAPEAEYSALAQAGAKLYLAGDFAETK